MPTTQRAVEHQVQFLPEGSEHHVRCRQTVEHWNNRKMISLRKPYAYAVIRSRHYEHRGTRTDP